MTFAESNLIELDKLLDDGGNVDGLHAEAYHVVFELIEVEQLVDETQQTTSVVGDDVESVLFAFVATSLGNQSVGT